MGQTDKWPMIRRKATRVQAAEATEVAMRKQEKAQRYATEPNRFLIGSIRATMSSQHGLRELEFKDGVWSCSCEYYETHSTCSHIMAIELILSRAGLRVDG